MKFVLTLVVRDQTQAQTRLVTLAKVITTHDTLTVVSNVPSHVAVKIMKIPQISKGDFCQIFEMPTFPGNNLNIANILASHFSSSWRKSIFCTMMKG